MFRRFHEHILRQVTDLRGIWDFTFLGDLDPEVVKDRFGSLNRETP